MSPVEVTGSPISCESTVPWNFFSSTEIISHDFCKLFISSLSRNPSTSKNVLSSKIHPAAAPDMYCYVSCAYAYKITAQEPSLPSPIHNVFYSSYSTILSSADIFRLSFPCVRFDKHHLQLPWLRQLRSIALLPLYGLRCSFPCWIDLSRLIA